jgi:hypothetical protein
MHTCIAFCDAAPQCLNDAHADVAGSDGALQHLVNARVCIATIRALLKQESEPESGTNRRLKGGEKRHNRSHCQQRHQKNKLKVHRLTCWMTPTLMLLKLHTQTLA